MLRTALRNLLGHRFRLLTTGFAITLGVAFVAGTLVLTDTLDRTLDEMFVGAYAKTDAVVRAEGTFEVTGVEQRPRIDEALVGRLAQLPGVADVQGEVWGFAQVVDPDGDPVGVPGAGPPLVGTSWADTALNTFTLEEGRGPKGSGEVVLDLGTAKRAGYSVGDRATVIVGGRAVEVTVTGVASFQGSDSPAGASFTMFALETAQELVGEPGKVDSIALSAMPGVSEEALVAEVEAVLPDGIEALTGDAFTKENQDDMAAALAFFNQFLFVFALVALLVGGFIIFNTFTITVAQRTRQHALLRAVGASRRQVLLSVLVEALLVGLGATIAGLAGGIGVAAGLKRLLAAFGIDLPAAGIVVSGRTLAWAAAAGLLVTLVAALAPARRAGSVPPVAALREADSGEAAGPSRLRQVLGLLTLGGGVATLLYGLWGDPAAGSTVVGVGAVIVFLGVAMAARAMVRPLAGALGAPLSRLGGMPGRLARQNAMRNPQRTATTASALMIGVALVAFITVFAASTKVSISKVIDRAFTGHLVVAAPGEAAGGGVAPGLTEALRALPEIEHAAGIRAGVAEIDGTVTPFVAVGPEAHELFDIDPRAGSPNDLDATSIAVQADVAEERGLEVGDPVRARFAHSGEQVLTVALIYGERQPAGDWVLGLPAFEANFPPAQNVDFQVFLDVADDVDVEAAVAAVEALTDEHPGTQVLDHSEYKASQLAFVDQILGLVYALLALALLIALLGIGNTLALSILERTQEIGLLRAVGMTRRQLRRTIRGEAVVIAVLGAALGLVVGLFFGWALVSALGDLGLDTLAVPYLQLAVIVAIAAVAGVVAAALPARRAARMDVLQAIVGE